MKKQTVVFIVLAHSHEMGVRMLENFSKILLEAGIRNNEIQIDHDEEFLLAALEYEIAFDEVDREYIYAAAEGYFGLFLEFVKYFEPEEARRM